MLYDNYKLVAILLYFFSVDDGCRPNTRRCGKSVQCVSVLAFCDEIYDCKNHYDEDAHRCCEKHFILFQRY